jgi:hypothetical protein
MQKPSSFKMLEQALIIVLTSLQSKGGEAEGITDDEVLVDPEWGVRVSNLHQEGLMPCNPTSSSRKMALVFGQWHKAISA